MCFPVCIIGIMDVIRGDQRNLIFLTHSKKLGIDRPLLRHPMVLELQEKVASAKQVL